MLKPTLIGSGKLPKVQRTAPIVIDGDIPLYKACCAVEREFTWASGETILQSDKKEAIECFDGIINTYLLSLFPTPGELKSHKVFIALSGPANWRLTVDPNYKAHRAKVRKPLCFHDTRTLVDANFEVLCAAPFEADDLLGMWSIKQGAILISEDKDLLTVPGFLFNPRTGDFTYSTELEADRRWMLQTLTGDSSDGYPGCPKIGAVKAARILDGASSLGEMFERVVATFVAAGQDRQRARQQASLARIVRGDENPLSKVWPPNLPSSAPVTRRPRSSKRPASKGTVHRKRTRR